MATTITLQYTTAGTDFTRNYDVQALRGFDDPDECQIIGVQNRYLNGSIDENILGFLRVVTIDFGVLQDYTDKEFLSRWMRNADREVQYSGLFMNVNLENPSGYANRWENDLVVGKRFFVRLIGGNLETIFTQGTGYGFEHGEVYGTGL